MIKVINEESDYVDHVPARGKSISRHKPIPAKKLIKLLMLYDFSRY